MTINRKKKIQIIFSVLVVSIILFTLPDIPKSYAHAYITKSDPSSLQSVTGPPTKVDVYFSDPVDVRYSQIKVLDSNGEEIQANDQHYINNDQTALSVSLPQNLKNGVYTVSTKVLDQTDGHVTEGGFVFAVGQQVPPGLATLPTTSNYQVISIPEAIARFPTLASQVMISGSLAATLWLWGPISRASPNRTLELKTRIDQITMRWLTIGSAILVASDVAMIIVQAYSINSGILDAISTKFGNMWAIRMILSLALLGLTFTVHQKMKKSPMLLPKQYVATLLGISFAVLATTSLISHGAATGKITVFLLDFVHNVFASLWIGGVMYIAFVVLPYLKKNIDPVFGASVIATSIPRFSILVSAILGAAAITGPFLLYMIEENPALTIASFYGKVLIVKLLLVAVMIAFGAYNQTKIYKSADMAIGTNNRGNSTIPSNDNRIVSKFSSTMKIEAFIGIALIASIAVLVDSGLPSSEFQAQLQSISNNAFAVTSVDDTNTFSQTEFVENGSRIVLTVSPFSSGNNDFSIAFLDPDKKPIDVKTVQLRLTQTDMGIGPITVDASKTDTWVFSTNTDFGFPGHWNVRVEGVQNKENSLNLVASYDLLVKPPLSSVSADIREFKTPDNYSKPLYPIYDSSRGKVWIGDSALKSGRLLEFDPSSGNYTTHKLDGINVITFSILDSHNTIWYTDPITGVIGNYDPSDQSNKVYPLDKPTILSGIAIDSNNTIWLTGANTSEVLKFDTNTHKFYTIKLANNANPLGITMGAENKAWIAEGSGKIASIDTSDNKIEEYTPTYANYTTSSPTAMVYDSTTGKLYISLHDGHAIAVFDPLLKTFERIQLDTDKNALPFGMVFDKYHNLWVAQHQLDKIAIVDTRTGKYIEKDVPTSNSWTQWITSDSRGDIIFAEQQANTIGVSSVSSSPSLSTNQVSLNNLPPWTLPSNSTYSQIVAPSIAGLLIAVAFFYSKGVSDLKTSLAKIKDYSQSSSTVVPVGLN